MTKRLLMGNEAIGLAAVHAGVGVVTGYPGTPSTEVLESVAKFNPGNIYVEWSVNEKVALEVAAGAAYSGVRTLVTMKQVGLNVASDPLMSLEYIGVKGGTVILVADDPGPISSQTEQDTRHFASFSKLPIFDPSSPEEAYEMMKDAFELSEKYSTPVFFRPTTRICHACATIDVDDDILPVNTGEFVRDPSKWVIFPRLSYNAHRKIEERNILLAEKLSDYRFNEISGSGRKGIAVGGVSFAYAREALSMLGAPECRILKIATPHPFPERLAADYLKTVDEVLVLEELDPVIERELIYICGKYNLNVKISGKLNMKVENAGELTTESVKDHISDFLGISVDKSKKADIPVELPIRPPVLCAGCPHRASFYAVKQAMKGKKAVFTGDIGCYTLGNAKPLDMVDTCLCMGADITIAQGIRRTNPDTVCFAFIGDSTFFHTGIPGVVNAVYNGTDMVVCVLDNSTTAMTGHQPNPNTGKTAMGEVAEKISIEAVLRAIGVKKVQTVDPLDLEAAKAAALRAYEMGGVNAIIFRSPCVAITKPGILCTVEDEKCIGCKKCLKELGCPALIKNSGKVSIDKSLCYGCGICTGICPVGAIKRVSGQ